VVAAEQADDVLAAFDAPTRALLAPHSAPTCAGWLCPAPPPEASFLTLSWFSPAETLVLARRRLGMDLALASPDSVCTLCGRAPATEDHVLRCMASGARKQLSARVVDAVASALRGGGSAATKEPAPFPTAPTLRGDLLFRLSGPTVHVVDVAISHASTPAAYAEVKRRKYADHAVAAKIAFTPLVWDMAGGMNPEALELLSVVGRRWGARYDVAPSHARFLCLAALNRVVMRGVAQLLLRGLGASSTELLSVG
jgi:hypothetical protein